MPLNFVIRNQVRSVYFYFFLTEREINAHWRHFTCKLYHWVPNQLLHKPILTHNPNRAYTTPQLDDHKRTNTTRSLKLKRMRSWTININNTTYAHLHQRQRKWYLDNNAHWRCIFVRSTASRLLRLCTRRESYLLHLSESYIIRTPLE